MGTRWDLFYDLDSEVTNSCLLGLDQNVWSFSTQTVLTVQRHVWTIHNTTQQQPLALCWKHGLLSSELTQHSTHLSGETLLQVSRQHSAVYGRCLLVLWRTPNISSAATVSLLTNWLRWSTEDIVGIGATFRHYDTDIDLTDRQKVLALVGTVQDSRPLQPWFVREEWRGEGGLKG